MKYSPEFIEEARRLWNDGIFGKVIAERLGVSKNVIFGLAYRKFATKSRPSQALDRTGERFGRLVVLSRTTNTARGGAVWLCICDCGNRANVRAASLAKGATKSCGCLLREQRATYLHRPIITDDRKALIEQARAYWDAGDSAKVIGWNLGVSKNAIIGIAHRYGFTPRPSPIIRTSSKRRRITTAATVHVP